MNAELLKLLVCDKAVLALLALMLCFSLGGCGKTENTSALEAQIEFSEVQDADIITETERAERFASAFAEAYFHGDEERLCDMTVQPYEHGISVYDGDIPGVYTVRGCEAAAAAEKDKPFAVTVEFAAGDENAALELHVVSTDTGYFVTEYSLKN